MRLSQKSPGLCFRVSACVVSRPFFSFCNLYDCRSSNDKNIITPKKKEVDSCVCKSPGAYKWHCFADGITYCPADITPHFSTYATSYCPADFPAYSSTYLPAYSAADSSADRFASTIPNQSTDSCADTPSSAIAYTGAPS